MPSSSYEKHPSTTTSTSPRANHESTQSASHGIAIPPKATTSASSVQKVPLCGCRCGGCTCSCCHSYGLASTSHVNRGAPVGQSASSGFGPGCNDYFGLDAPSLEARGSPNLIVAVPPSLEILAKFNGQGPAELAQQRIEKYLEDVDGNPRRDLVFEPSFGPDTADASSLFFGPMDMDGSMDNNAASTCTSPMLSSMLSAISARSQSASAIIRHSGTGVGSPQPNSTNQDDDMCRDGNEIPAPVWNDQARHGAQ